MRISVKVSIKVKVRVTITIYSSYSSIRLKISIRVSVFIRDSLRCLPPVVILDSVLVKLNFYTRFQYLMTQPCGLHFTFNSILNYTRRN